jgi:hypothetical protein
MVGVDVTIVVGVCARIGNGSDVEIARGGMTIDVNISVGGA